MEALLTDDTVLAELGRRLARARLARNQSQGTLAKEAGIGERTLARVEAGESTTVVNLVRILRALDLLENLDALVPADTVNPIVARPARGRARQRASRATEEPSRPSGRWVWGDERDGAP